MRRPGRRRRTRSHGRCGRRRSPASAPTSMPGRSCCSKPTSSPPRRRPPISTSIPDIDAAPARGRRRRRAAARRRVRARESRPRQRSGHAIRPVGLAQPAYAGPAPRPGSPHQRRRAPGRVRDAPAATGRRRSDLGPWPTPTARRVVVDRTSGCRSPSGSWIGRRRARRSRSTVAARLVDVRIEPSGSAPPSVRRRRAARPERGRSSGRRSSCCTMPMSEAAVRSVRCPAP